jgi:hypothetical protein
MGPHGTVHTDFTVVANSGGPMCRDPNDVLNTARLGASDPDYFVVQKGDKPKMKKYVNICRAAGFSFIPFAL